MNSLHNNQFLNGGGEMGELIRARDWSKTPLGDPSDWPYSLRTMVSVMLDNPFGMYIAWGKDYIQLYNDGYRPILGSTKHPHALGISTRETFSEIWHIIGAMFDDVMKGNAVGSTDFLLSLSRNGFVEDCYFDFSYSPIRKDDGEVGGVLVTVIETTDKKKAQSELKESKDQLQFAIDASDLATWDLDIVSNCFTGNDRLKEWHGLQAGESFALERGFDWVIEKDRDALKNAIYKAQDYASGGALDHEYTLLNPYTKKERIVRAKGRTSFSANNFAYRLNGIVEDVTEQVIAKRKIEESERSLRLMIIQAPVAICVFKGSNHVVEIANDLMLELWGKTAEEVFNKPIFEGLPEAAGQGLEQIVDTVFATGQKFVANEWPVKLPRKDKLETTYVNFVYEVLINTDGSVSGIMAIATDVSVEVNARKKIEESEEQLRIALEGGELGTFDYYPESGSLIWSDKTKELFGLGPGAPVNLELYLQAIHPDDRAASAGITRQQLELEKNGFYELEYRTIGITDGKLRWLRSKGKARYNSLGQPVRYTGIIHDVTERKKGEEALKKSEERFRTLADNIPNLVWMANEDGRIYWYNKKWYEYTGTTPEQPTRWNWQSLLHPNDLYIVPDKWDETIATGKPLEIVFQLKGADGKYRSFLTRVLPVLNNDGKIYQWLGTNTDITDQKEAERVLKENDLRFRNTVNQAPIGITILRGADYLVEMANDAYLQVVDRKETEFVGKPLFDSLPEVKETVLPLLNDVLSTGVPFHGVEYPVPINRNGKVELSYFDFLYHPLKEADGEITGIIVTVTDVSASVKAKYTLAESEKQFRDLVMQSPIAMTIFRGEDHIIEMANEVMVEKLWRKKECEVIGKKVLEVFPELKEQKYAELLGAVFHSGISHNEKESLAYVAGNDGIRKFYLDYEYRPLFQTDGSVFGIMITVYDVTEKVLSRKKVEESEERLRMAIQMTSLGTWEYNPISGELNWSDECREIYGLPEHEQVDFQLFSKHIHPQDKAFVESAIRQATDPSGQGNYDIIYRILRFKDNGTRWIRAKGKVYFNTVNEAERFIGTVVDITEQKLSQQILEESEQRSRLSIEAANMGTFDWNLITNEFSPSQRLNDIFGFHHRSGITHKDLINAFLPEDRHLRDEAVDMALLKGALSYEARIQWPDKSIHWIRVYGKIIYNEDKPAKMYGIVVDSTREKMDWEALEEGTERLNIAIEAAELGMWELDIKKNKVFYSARYLEILGYNQSIELTHEEILSHLHKDDLPVREAAFKKAFVTGTLQYESRIIWKDKSIHWIEGKGKVFYNESKEPIRLMGTLRDITDEKYYQQELIDRERKFRLLADSMPEFVWTGNTEGDINYFNQSVYNYTGLTTEQFKNGGWLQIIHPDEREENKRKWMLAVRMGKDFLFEHRFRKFDGTYRWQLSRAVPQRDAEGNIQMWVGTSTDIEEQKVFTNKLELQVKERTAELQKVNEALEKSNIELEQFAYVASHDLQEPLRKISFFTERLENSMINAEEKSKEYYHKIQKASDRMNTLIKDLLDFSRLSKKNEVFVRTDLNEIVNNVLQDLELLIQQKEAIIECTALPLIEAIPLQMQQLFYNLLVNSLKFSKTDISPLIQITVDELRLEEIMQYQLVENLLYYKIIIRDNGIGFGQEYAEQIFVIFQRLNDLYTYGGTGIGLALCRKIVLNHHGKIFAASVEGEGAAFYIILPALQHRAGDEA